MSFTAHDAGSNQVDLPTGDLYVELSAASTSGPLYQAPQRLAATKSGKALKLDPVTIVCRSPGGTQQLFTLPAGLMMHVICTHITWSTPLALPANFAWPVKDSVTPRCVLRHHTRNILLGPCTVDMVGWLPVQRTDHRKAQDCCLCSRSSSAVLQHCFSGTRLPCPSKTLNTLNPRP